MTTASHSGGKLDYLYKGLLYDVYKRNTVANHVFSDGYDYEDKKEDDYTTSKNVCLQGHFYDLVQAHSHDGSREKCDSILFSEENDCVNYTEYDTIISKMNLKHGEEETLNCYMAGMTYCEIARFLGVNFSTIYRRKMSLQRKYLKIFFNIYQTYKIVKNGFNAPH